MATMVMLALVSVTSICRIHHDPHPRIGYLHVGAVRGSLAHASELFEVS